MMEEAILNSMVLQVRTLQKDQADLTRDQDALKEKIKSLEHEVGILKGYLESDLK